MCVQSIVQSQRRNFMPSTLERRSKRINIRASAKEEELMRRGAAQRGKTLTEFIVESACTEAEETLTERGLFVLPKKRWRLS
jgi:uncharacterized protein (DUF1778 family)